MRDTTAWTIASILKVESTDFPSNLQNHPMAVAHVADELLKCLCESLGDPSPRVAGHACYAIHNLALSFSEEPNNPLNKFFVDVSETQLLI